MTDIAQPRAFISYSHDSTEHTDRVKARPTDLPVLLREFAWADLREGISKDGLRQIALAASGRKEAATAHMPVAANIHDADDASEGEHLPSIETVSAPQPIGLDLYDRRIEIYRQLKSFLLKMTATGDIELSDLRSFGASIDETQFLFGDDIHSYLDGVYRRALRLRVVMTYLKEPSRLREDELRRFTDESTDLLMWFTDQFTVAPTLFRRYLPVA